MSGFPDKFRDLTAFSGDGLDYSTSSNTAVKMFDALVNQVRLCVVIVMSLLSIVTRTVNEHLQSFITVHGEGLVGPCPY